MPDSPLEIHVVAHTHWDREWYHPAARFQQRLVALIDELLADPPPPGESFLLDGQALLVDDYLDVRPDRADAMHALLRSTRIEAGPWYVLADELIPSGEALVRNLLAGRSVLGRAGAASPPVLYCPDSFGHPSVLPLLAREFDFIATILWRGYGGARWPDGDTVEWRSPHGATTLLFHLPPAGYEFGASLPLDDRAAAGRWLAMRAVLATRAATGVTLVQNGADHHARQRGQSEAVDALRRAAAPERVIASSLGTFARALATSAQARALPVIEGELRDSYGYTWTLQGTFATRAQQKRRNALAERLLVRDAEPWAALAQRRVGSDRAHLLRAAWRALLRCHPHDTLCGCSIDPVARAMDARLADALIQGRGVRDDALLDLIGHDAAEASERVSRWTPVVVVRNAAARVRTGVAEVRVTHFTHDVPVGPGSVDSVAPVAPTAFTPDLALIGVGGPVPLQLLARSSGVELTESPRQYPNADAISIVRALAWVQDVPGYGTRSLAVTTGGVRALPAGVSPATASQGCIENGILRAEWRRAEGVRLIDLRSGRVVEQLIALEDQDDRGDLYTPSLRGEPVRGVMTSARAVHVGPLRATAETLWLVRTGVFAEIELSLDAGADFIRLRVRGVNGARDHRLRVVLGTDVRDASVWADAAYGPVQRVPLDVPAADRIAEIPPATAPLHRYVSLCSGLAGATVFSDGLAEYEVLSGGAVAITLVRAVGELSRNDLPERPGHAGWPAPTPGAQSLGRFRCTLALLLHDGRSPATSDRIERTADDVLLPLRGATLRSALRVPEPTSGVELEGSGLAFSACKPSEDGDRTVLRCVNVTSEPIDGQWRLGWHATEVWLSRLDETPVSRLPTAGGVIHFHAPPRAVVTLLVR